MTAPARLTALTAERLRYLFNYDPTTGLFIRLVWLTGNANIGDVADYTNKQGYIQIKVDGKCYQGHRLAWLYMTGEWPVADIDHRDGCRSNNKWSNLRAASLSQNARNSRRPNRNTSGFKGVSHYRKNGQRWRARIRHNDRQLHLGVFDTPEEAHAAYSEAAKQIFHEFARTA